MSLAAPLLARRPFASWRRPGLAMAAIALAILAVLVALRVTGATEMSAGMLVVIALRLFVPLVILRWWLMGGLIAMLLDAADVILVDLMQLGGFGGRYAETDKYLDSWYYVLELIVALGWASPWMRVPAVALFAFRVVGAVLFELTGDHIILFYFPNMFENWWLYCVVVQRWFPRLVPHDAKSVVIPMLILLVPKMGQEYLLHFTEAHPWDWMKEEVLPKAGIHLLLRA